jgi:hypothetical protein
MKDIETAFWIKAKGLMFLAIGLIASALIWMDHPELKTALYLALAIWSFCRFYYFAFYVIEHYVDPGYRFSGLWSFARYMMRRRKK